MFKGRSETSKEEELSMNEQTLSRLTRLISAAAVVGVMLLLGFSTRAQETGESLFKGKCAMCHGADGAAKTTMGQTLKIPDLHSADVQKMSDAELKTVIGKGKGKMPGYETKLSKEQIDELVGFIRDLGKKH
jgi:cytochrome c6